MGPEDLFDSYNAGYVQELYERFVRDPASVPPEWRRVFADGTAEAAGLLPPEGVFPPAVPEAPPAPGAAPPEELLSLIARATALVQAFREHGHQLARLDPLGSEPPGHPQLDPSFFGVTREELGRIPASVVGIGDGGESVAEALERLRQAYCGTLGYEFEHLENPEMVSWLWEQVESGAHRKPLDPEEEKALLRRLVQVEGLERFLHRAYLGQKRFSLEGTDMLVPMLDVALEEAAGAGAGEVIIGMAHRGRLNVLAHTVGLPYEEIVAEFEGGHPGGPETTVVERGTGDVKYHRGAEGLFRTRDGRAVRVVLAPNPSHLEFVNPVVEGIARARQTREGEGPGETDPARVLPILIHGDAAFAAEGVVAETLNLARLRGYRTGGTLHLIVNNQIGFTTGPEQGRSTRYASDLAKGYDIPVIHVNAEDPEACLAAVRLALAYRNRFRCDVVIDLVGYRRHGHNEADEPAYTQPVLYARVQEHPTVLELWARRLVAEGTVTAEEVDRLRGELARRLEEVRDAVRTRAAPAVEEEPRPREPRSPEVETAVPLERLRDLNRRLLTVPEGFTVHPKLKRQLDRRREAFGEEHPLEWAHAELLALASLLDEGIPLRLSGQDTERGTFSQRHLVLHDAETGEGYTLLSGVGGARFEVFNSPLSEMGALGFEYGFSVGEERGLVLWEAQFGDFANAAQVIIDQFIAAGLTKWGQTSRLTLLLPHGYEGQGPEHSSARIERFLQLAAEGNLRIVYPTTPAQYFHLLRRQALAEEQRPLVVFTPKSLLRHPLATSPVRELARGRFARILDGPVAGGGDGREVRRLVLCSGKVYYDLVGSEEWRGTRGIAVARLEELYPFPARELAKLMASYPALEEVLWTQEEPRNMGALTYVGPRLRATAPRGVALRFVARPERASPAEGRAVDHVREQARIVRDALRVPPPSRQ